MVFERDWKDGNPPSADKTLLGLGWKEGEMEGWKVGKYWSGGFQPPKAKTRR